LICPTKSRVGSAEKTAEEVALILPTRILGDGWVRSILARAVVRICPASVPERIEGINQVLADEAVLIRPSKVFRTSDDVKGLIRDREVVVILPVRSTVSSSASVSSLVRPCEIALAVDLSASTSPSLPYEVVFILLAPSMTGGPTRNGVPIRAVVLVVIRPFRLSGALGALCTLKDSYEEAIASAPAANRG
jgi:hypothetical protein